MIYSKSNATTDSEDSEPPPIYSDFLNSDNSIYFLMQLIKTDQLIDSTGKSSTEQIVDIGRDFFSKDYEHENYNPEINLDEETDPESDEKLSLEMELSLVALKRSLKSGKNLESISLS